MKLLEILKTEFAETPPAWGWFHIMMVSISILVTVLLCVFFRNSSDKVLRKIVLVCWIIFVVLEIYKEFTFREDWIFDESGKLLRVEYNWYLFPYQFCSTPLYILPFIVFLPEGKVRNAFMSYTSTFILFAGLMILLVPGDVYVKQIGICIQTMIQHGMQFFLGVFITFYNSKNMKHSLKDIVNYYWPGVIVFIGMASIAMILNEVVVASGVLNGETFNMFFISRHFPCTLVILSSIYPLVPYPIFLIGYLIGFALIAAIVLAIQLGINLLVELIINKRDKISAFFKKPFVKKTNA